MTAIKNRSMQVAEKLREAGFNASAYSAPPAGNNLIVGKLDVELIKVWVPDHVELDIDINTKHSQAVFRAKEPDREVVDRVNISVPCETLLKSNKVKQGLKIEDFLRSHTTEEILDKIYKNQRSFKILQKARPTTQVQNVASTKRRFGPLSKTTQKANRQTVNSLKKRLENIENNERISGVYWYGHIVFTVEVVQHARESEFSLLMGVDEVAHFVAALPEPVKTVEQAHEVLRPAYADATTKRQGEWFFKSIKTEKIQKNLDAIYDSWRKDNERLINSGYFSRRTAFESKYGSHNIFYRNNYFQLEPSSSHTAEHLVVKGFDAYVKGEIIDTRPRHHEPFVLEGWHKLLRNKEVTVPTDDLLEQSRRARRWD